MSNLNEPPLDEIQWRSPQAVQTMGGLHSNSILFYFAESPFFERTSNNAVLMSQAMNNLSMFHFIQTREAFEGRLKTMSGLEFMVSEEPAEMGPGMGTGVWVIHKQTRRKIYQEEDEITLHAAYFVVGENIYMAPTLSDILASRIMTISAAIDQALSAADGLRKWRPATGNTYHLPSSQPVNRPSRDARASKEGTPMPEAAAVGAATGAASRAVPAALHKYDETSLERVAEEAFVIHTRYGGEYIDENPITGRPGDFHLSSTGRKPVLPPSSSSQTQQPRQSLTVQTDIGAMNGPAGNRGTDKKDGKGDRTPKSATMSKLKRRKSKSGATPAAS